jgi:hypothetical protein
VQDTTIHDGPGSRKSLRTWTLALLAAATLAGCGSSTDTADRAAAAKASPEAAPSIDDSSVTIEAPPEGAATVGGAPGAIPVDPSPEPVPSSALDPAGTGVTGAGSTTARTVPGVADRATALPPSASVPNDDRCRVSALRLAPIDLQGSPGGTYANFRVTNTSRSACAVRGFVGARLIADGGQDLPTTVRHEAGPDVWVKVGPGGSAQFHLRFPNPMSGEAPCNPPNAAKVRISLPGVAGSLTSTTPEGGIQACNGIVSTAPIGST